MDYQQFVVAIKEKIAQSLGSGMDLQIHTALKNNGKERTGISISDKTVNISPTIYLEEYYRQFENGLSIETITSSILDVYQEVRLEHSWKIEPLKTLSEIQPKISYKLIHAKKNETLLQTLPHIPYLDLAIVFYILFEVEETGTATIPITHDFLNLWGITLTELHDIASKNAPTLLPALFKPMRVVIEELLGSSCDESIQDNDIMFVLTNPLRNFGAACILYPGILEQIACQLGENFFILPSSIHEVIIIAESQSPKQEDLQDMVRDINETQVDIEEFLSDTIYYYNFKDRTLLP